MARKIIDTGTLGNPATGDSLRTAMTKINTNFEELYIGNSADGQLTTSVTNGDISIQPNGTGTVEIDALSVNSDNITSLTTNSSITITGNGTAGVDIEGISVNGTTISSSDSSTININENLIVDGTGEFSGTLSVTGASTLTAGATIDGISITDNTITTASSNANLELSAAGTGDITADTDIHITSATPFIKLQRTDNANVPGIDFIGSAGTSGAKLLFDGTSGSANELIFQTFTVAGGLAEAFRVQGGGAKVTGTLDVDGGISITDNTITSSASNADLELNASGSGTIVLENLKVGTGATVTTILDEDNMSSDSATALATQQSIKAYVDSQGGSTGAMTFSGNTMSTASNADIEITPGGTGNVNLNGDTVRVGDNDADATITTQGTGDLILNTNGGTNSGTITLRDGSNGDIILEPDGTGDVLLKGNKVGVGTVNQPDTLLHLKDTNAVITLQRTADANTPGLSFQNSNGNVRGVIKLDGTSGTSNEIFMQTYDGSSQAERFRVTHTGAKVSGTLNVDDGISIADNTITSSASNADLEINASGTGTVVLENLKVGTGATVTTILDEDNMASNSATALATQQSIKAYVDAEISGVSTASTGDLAITGSTISAPSNADLTLNAGGTGSVDIEGIQIKGTEISSSDSSQVTIKENLHVTGNITGTITGSIDADNSTVSNLEVDNFKASAIVTEGEGIGSNDNDTTIPTSAAVKDYVDSNPTTSLAADNLTTGDAAITIATTTGDITLDTQGNNRDIIFKGTDGGVDITPLQIDMSEGGKAIFQADIQGQGVTISDNTITSNRSNDNLVLAASGTGVVSIDGIQISGTSISSTDSTQININENVNIDGTLTVSGAPLSGTLNTVGNTGSGSVALASETLQVTGTTNEINVAAAAFALSLSLADDISGIVSVTASSFLANDAIKIIDNKVTGTRTNENVELEANGTGSLVAQSPFVAQSPITFNAGYIEKINTLTSSPTITVDCSAASIHKVTLATNTGFVITNLPTGGTVTLIITQDGGGGNTATFGTDSSTAVKFPGGAPTLSTGAGDIDVVTIVNDGTNFLGNCAKNYS